MSASLFLVASVAIAYVLGYLIRRRDEVERLADAFAAGAREGARIRSGG